MEMSLSSRSLTACSSRLRVPAFTSRPVKATKMVPHASLTLYTNPRSRGKIVEWYIAERGIPCEMKQVSFEKREHKADWFLKINPRGQLPALTDGDLKLFESGALLLYIADKYDPTITTAEQRGIAAQWVLFANATLGPALFDPAKREKEMPGLMEFLENQLKGNQWLVGSELTVSDVAVGAYLLYMLLFFPDLSYSPWPIVEDYVKRLKARPACTVK